MLSSGQALPGRFFTDSNNDSSTLSRQGQQPNAGISLDPWKDRSGKSVRICHPVSVIYDIWQNCTVPGGSIPRIKYNIDQFMDNR